MRWSQSFIPTLREDPTGVESASHRLLMRAGYIQQTGSGIYSLLPLAVRVRKKIIQIIQEELVAIGAQECLLPCLSPTGYWKQSGRLDSMGDIMFRFKDRKGSELVLGVTHEEIFTSIAAKHINSHKQLPQIWYQFQTKFRDEVRPRGGLLRVREFTMKDSYSFDLDEEGLQKSYEKHRLAYERIFERCRADVKIAEASSGIMGGAQSAEFHLITDCGEDRLIVCEGCHYTANLEKAKGQVVPIDDGNQTFELEKFATPDIRTIAELASFKDGTSADRQIKTLVYKGPKGFYILLLRGDQELNQVELSNLLGEGTDQIEPALSDQIFELLGAHPGSLGAVNIGSAKATTIADLALRGRFNMQTGANQDGFHFRNVSIDRDIIVHQWAQVAVVKEGDQCTNCKASLSVKNALEVGHIFQLGTKYSSAMSAYYLVEDGSKVAIQMGSYGIGVERLMAAVIESSFDQNGIIWPISVAPYQVLITVVNSGDPFMQEGAEKIYGQLKELGLEVLLDDRAVRAGVKFNDGDLIGIPIRITVGKRLTSQEVEVLERRTMVSEIVSLLELPEFIDSILKRGS